MSDNIYISLDKKYTVLDIRHGHIAVEYDGSIFVFNHKLITVHIEPTPAKPYKVMLVSQNMSGRIAIMLAYQWTPSPKKRCKFVNFLSKEFGNPPNFTIERIGENIYSHVNNIQLLFCKQSISKNHSLKIFVNDLLLFISSMLHIPKELIYQITRITCTLFLQDPAMYCIFRKQ